MKNCKCTKMRDIDYSKVKIRRKWFSVLGAFWYEVSCGSFYGYGRTSDSAWDNFMDNVDSNKTNVDIMDVINC